MNQKKKIVIPIILVSLIILSITISSNTLLLDRGLYRIGIQEQVCFSDTTEDHHSQDGKNFVFVGDFFCDFWPGWLAWLPAACLQMPPDANRSLQMHPDASR